MTTVSHLVAEGNLCRPWLGGSYQAVMGNFPAHLIEATSQRGNNWMPGRERTLTLKLQFLERRLLLNTKPWSQESMAAAAHHLSSRVSKIIMLDFCLTRERASTLQ